MTSAQRILFSTLALAAATTACGGDPLLSSEYLFVWAGDSAGVESDFLAVLDADPASAHYGEVVASLPTGAVGTHPHHTEPTLSPDGHLLANGFAAGRSWLFDLSAPRTPRILASFDDLGGFSHPHSFLRLPNGHVLATFQYRVDASQAPMTHDASAMSPAEADGTGGLVEMTERGEVIRSRSATDPAIQVEKIFPYSVLPLPALDRALSTTTNMSEADTTATYEWVQLWRLSDLTLLKSIALPPGPRGDEQYYTGEPLLLPDGTGALVHTFNCGLYLVRELAGDQPTASFVHKFQGQNCGVPVLTGHYWLQTVPEAHAVVALDISDPEHPKEVSSVGFGDTESPHWLAIDQTGRRVVMNSAGRGRLFLINFDPTTGALAIDSLFRDPGSDQPGISMQAKQWPHGFRGTAIPHGTVFSR
jgi:hypothetical protein